MIVTFDSDALNADKTKPGDRIRTMQMELAYLGFVWCDRFPTGCSRWRLRDDLHPADVNLHKIAEVAREAGGNKFTVEYTR